MLHFKRRLKPVRPFGLGLTFVRNIHCFKVMLQINVKAGVVDNHHKYYFL